MKILSTGVFADLGREVICDSHVEHHLLDFTHLLGVCIQLFLGQGTLNLFGNNDHLAGFLLQRVDILEGSSDLFLIELSSIFFGLDEARHTLRVVGAFLLAEILQLCLLLRFCFYRHRPMSLCHCILEQF